MQKEKAYRRLHINLTIGWKVACFSNYPEKETTFIQKKNSSTYKCKTTLEQFKAELMVKINQENLIKGNEDNISRVKSDWKIV